MNEVEAKLLVNDETDAASRIRDVLAGAGLRVGPETIRKTTDTYFDTRNWDLFRYGWTCRVREGERENTLGMKKRTDTQHGIARREELESAVQAPPRNPDDIPVGPMRTLYDEATDGLPLEPLFSLEKTRHVFDVDSESGWLAKAAFDEVSQRGSKTKRANAAQEYREFELEMVEGSEETLTSLCKLLERKLALTPARLNKFERAARRTSPEAPSRFKFSFGKDRAVGDLAHPHLARCFADLLWEEPLAWEGIDPEGVHQMRVAIRRIRTVFKTLSDLYLSPTTRVLQKELSWLASALGGVRDLDVYQSLIRKSADDLMALDADAIKPYHDHLAAERLRARRRLMQVLGSRRYRDFKVRFQRFLANAPFDKASWEEPAIDAARRTVVAAAKQLRKGGEKLNADSPDADFHRLRIRGKRFRYVLELFAPLLGKRVDPTLRLTRKLQDCLGNHHDACMADAKLRTYAERAPLRAQSRIQLIALGELIHFQRVVAHEERAAFFKLWPEVAKKTRPSKIGKKCSSL